MPFQFKLMEVYQTQHLLIDLCFFLPTMFFKAHPLLGNSPSKTALTDREDQIRLFTMETDPSGQTSLSLLVWYLKTTTLIVMAKWGNCLGVSNPRSRSSPKWNQLFHCLRTVYLLNVMKFIAQVSEAFSRLSGIELNLASRDNYFFTDIKRFVKFELRP